MSNPKKIAIINYEMGNIGSIVNMIKKIGFEVSVVNDPQKLTYYDYLILPGVGNFERGVNQLKDLNFYDFLSSEIKTSDTKLLGICLGMQLLFDSSEEGEGEGLGLIRGKVKKFENLDAASKIPHMGWNFIKKKKKLGIFDFCEKNSRFYFVHSYFCDPENLEDVSATSTYGGKEFSSIVNFSNIYGTQFHPEKSHKFGFQLLKGFLNL